MELAGLYRSPHCAETQTAAGQKTMWIAWGDGFIPTIYLFKAIWTLEPLLSKTCLLVEVTMCSSSVGWWWEPDGRMPFWLKPPTCLSL